MNRVVIVTVIAVTGAVLWLIQARKIADLRSELRQITRNTSERDPQLGRAGRIQDRPLPTKRPRASDKVDRISVPERRNAPPAADSPSGSTRLVTHLAGELADQMRLSAEQRTRVLPLLERHTATRRKAATELLDSRVYHYADLPDTEGNVLSALGDHAAFHAAARMINADTTKEIDPLLDPAARDILKTQDEAQRANTMTLLADGEYTGWKDLLGFEGVEQQAYEIFYDLSEFRLTHPLPENFTREELVTRLADERRFLTESLTPLLSEEKALDFRQALDALDSIGKTPARR